MSVGKAFIQPAAWGGLVGALGGSFSKMPNGNSWAGPAAIGGAGAMTALAVLLNAKRWPLLAAPIIGAEAGALVGAALGAAEDGKIVKGSADDLGEPSKVGEYAARFAGPGAAAALVLHFLAPASALTATSLGHPTQRVTMMTRGERVGLRIAW